MTERCPKVRNKISYDGFCSSDNRRASCDMQRINRNYNEGFAVRRVHAKTGFSLINSVAAAPHDTIHPLTSTNHWGWINLLHTATPQLAQTQTCTLRHDGQCLRLFLCKLPLGNKQRDLMFAINYIKFAISMPEAPPIINFEFGWKLANDDEFYVLCLKVHTSHFRGDPEGHTQAAVSILWGNNAPQGSFWINSPQNSTSASESWRWGRKWLCFVNLKPRPEIESLGHPVWMHKSDYQSVNCGVTVQHTSWNFRVHSLCTVCLLNPALPQLRW